jgi:hypothetical protein
MLFVILNFPYLPHQLRLLRKSNIDVSFLSIIPDGPITPAAYERHDSATKVPQKKPILGNELDFTQNPSAYPPARWQAIIAQAPASVAFNEVRGDEMFEKLFRNIELEVVRIHRAQSVFSEFLDKVSIRRVPSVAPNVNLVLYRNYVADHPTDDDAPLYAQLAPNHFRTVAPDPPPSEADQYAEAMQAVANDCQRPVVSVRAKEIADPVFSPRLVADVAFRNLAYPLTRYKISQQNALDVRAVSEFISSPVNFYAYAGQRFDAMVTAANKKYQLGLPMSFFDFQHWNWQREIPAPAVMVPDMLNDARLVETFLDGKAAILWLLIMKPIPRTMGSFMTFGDVPFCIENITEFMAQILENPSANEKRPRNPPTPAQIVHDSLDFGLIVPSLEQKMASAHTCYKMSSSTCQNWEFVTPYFFEPHFHLNIVRTFENAHIDFGYHFYYTDMFTLVSTGDTFLLTPFEGFRFLVEFGKAATLIFDERSIRCDESNMTIGSGSDCPIIITRAGDLIFQTGKKYLICHGNGAISKYEKGEWTTIDSKGRTVQGSSRRGSSIHFNPATGATKLVRPDDIEYEILPGGKRRIHVDPDFVVEHNNEDGIVIELPDFPEITVKDREFLIEIESFTVVFGQNQSLKITYPSYSFDIQKEIAQATFERCEVRFTPTQCQVKCGETLFFSDKNGNEKVGTLAAELPPGKKKIQFLETFWGPLLPAKETLQEFQQLSLHQSFAPHFIGIRADLSAFEFLRPDSLDTSEFESMTTMIPVPNAEPIELISFHHLTQPPIACLQFEKMTKIVRSNLLKNLHVPKPAKKKPLEEAECDTVESAELTVNNAISGRATVMNFVERAVAQAQEAFDEAHLEPQPIPEPPLKIPPHTPMPRVLKTAHWRTREATNMNYWLSPESEFAYADASRSGRSNGLSPRTLLFDPPRFFKQNKDNIELIQKQESFVTQESKFVPRGATPKRRLKGTGQPESERWIALLGVAVMDFGDVPLGETRIGSMAILNIGRRPLHFILSQLTCPGLSLLTLPGVIYSGLSLTIKVKLEAVVEGLIIDSLSLRTGMFERGISVVANIVPKGGTT